MLYGCIPLHGQYEYYKPRDCGRIVGNFPHLGCAIEAPDLRVEVFPPWRLPDTTLTIRALPTAGMSAHFRPATVAVSACGSKDRSHLPLRDLGGGGILYGTAEMNIRPECLEIYVPDISVEGRANSVPTMRFDLTKESRWTIPTNVGY
jgi:hypothetical protein